jgi:hypothetical protein
VSASEKLGRLDERMTDGPWSVWEYSDASVYVEAGSVPDDGGGVVHGVFVAELRENSGNRLDEVQDACTLRNALPELRAVVEAAGVVSYEFASLRDYPEGRELADALAALDAALGDER